MFANCAYACSGGSCEESCLLRCVWTCCFMCEVCLRRAFLSLVAVVLFGMLSTGFLGRKLGL